MFSDDIKAILKDHHTAHTDFQIEHFMIGSQGHPFFQFKQCQREIATRWETVKALQEKLKAIENKKRQKQVDKIGAALIEKELAGPLRELRKLVKLAKALYLKLNYDGLNEKAKGLLEAQAWFEKAKTMMALDIVAYGNVSRKTVEFIVQLPKTERQMLIPYIKKPELRQKLLVDELENK